MIVGLMMTTLRLYRAQIVVTGALLAALVGVTLLGGRSTQALLDAYVAGSCARPDCSDVLLQVDRQWASLATMLPYLALVPTAIGAFWGAPCVAREYEAGTTRLALTQSVTRRSWIVTRMVVLAVFLAIGGAIAGTAVDAWMSTFVGLPLPGAVEAEIGFGQSRGLAPVGWWLLAFAIGATGGAVLRRTIPAMVVTVAAVVALVIARNLWFGVVAGGQPPVTLRQFAHIETGVLVTASLLLVGGTCWAFERARA